MHSNKISYLDIEAAVDDRDESRWSTKYKGHTIDVDLAEVEPDLWAINVSVRAAGWADNLRFTNREAARVAGEQIGIRFIDDLD